MEYLEEVLDECNKGDKLHLARLKKFARAHPDIRGHLPEDLDAMTPTKARKAIIKLACKLITVKEASSPASSQKKKKKSVAASSTPKLPLPPPKDDEDDTDLPTVPKFRLKVGQADEAYLKQLKKEVEALEQDTYGIHKLEDDVTTNDTFVQRLVDAQLKSLQCKLKLYKKLRKIDWGGTEAADDEKKPAAADLNDILERMVLHIEEELQRLQATSARTLLTTKRNALLSILYDPDNGILTLKGKSRENVRILLCKMIYMFAKVPEFFFKGFINFMVTGPAGSGKTKVAGCISHMFQHLGILGTNKVVMATKQNLVGQYMGTSGPRTRALLANTLEGVVFIDEAYSLTPCPAGVGDGAQKNGPTNEYSEEAVAELINFMDKFIGCIVVIVAGYKDKMNDCFLAFNEGMARRFPRVIDFVPYTGNDLFQLFSKFFNDTAPINKVLSKEHRAYLRASIKELNKHKLFNNQAGDMLNLAKVISEDALLFEGTAYTQARMQLGLKRFCAAKGMALEF